MKTISIINLKGGVGKTTTAVNLAYALGEEMNYHILLVDNDKQGNASQHYGVHSYDASSVADIFEGRTSYGDDAITGTGYDNIDMIPANMDLLDANLHLIYNDVPQHHLLRDSLCAVQDDYDFCIIDNAPDINMTTINALAASDFVVVPVNSDAYATDGIDRMMDIISDARKFNPDIVLAGCLLCKYQNNAANQQMLQFLQSYSQYHVFDTKIRLTPKIDESTFYRAPVFDYSPRSAATADYREFAAELLCRIAGGADSHG